MYIASIEYPGTWIKFENDNKGFELNNLLSSMETHINDMAITLTMFEGSRQNINHNRDPQSEWEKDRKLRMDAEIEYKNSLEQGTDIYQNYDYHRNQIDKYVREIKLKKGVIPKSYQHRFSFIHAHSFMSSADSFSKFLNVLFSESENTEIKKLIDEFNERMPALRQVRNSAQHSEDRSRGYGKPADIRKNKKMALQPIDNNFIKSEGGVLALSCLNGNRLGYTIDDGSYQEVEISIHTLAYMTEVFQKAVNSFDWHGPIQLKPYL